MTSILSELNVFFVGSAGRLPDGTQRYIRSFGMSSSQSLTFTESLRLQALVALVAWIFSKLTAMLHVLRSLPWYDRNFNLCGVTAKSHAVEPLGRGYWSLVESAFWFDTSCGRYGPALDGWQPQRPLFSCRVTSYCQSDQFAQQAAGFSKVPRQN